MPGWGRPLASFLVADPPVVTDLPERPGRAFQIHKPGPLGLPPNLFPPDYGQFRGTVAQTRLTRVRVTQLLSEVWARTDASATSVRSTQFATEVWTKNFRNTSIQFNRDALKIGPNSLRGSPFPSFIDALTIATLRDTPAPPSPSTQNILQDDRFRSKFFGIGRGPYNLVERGRGLGGGSGIGPTIPTNYLRSTQVATEIWSTSDRSTRGVATQVASEVWMMSDRDPWYRSTQHVTEIWTVISSLPPSSFVPTFLWVD